jgi:hypothetical protein
MPEEELVAGLDEVWVDDLGNKVTSRFLVYGLFDPRSRELRYIGKSSSGLRRPRNHCKETDLKRHGRTPKTAWIRSLLSLGLRPLVMVLSEHPSADTLYEEEQRIIKLFRGKGAALKNLTDGGPGRWGYKLSDESKAKIRKAAIAQQKRSPTRHGKKVREKLRKLQLGRVHSEEHRLNMARAHGAKPFVEVTTGLVFENQSQAARHFKLLQPRVGQILSGKRKSSHGYSFRYL